jgi:hypothetical protein
MPSIIRPTDFAQFESKTRTLGSWDPATLERLVPHLAGLDCIVVVSDRSGHAVTGQVVGYKHSTHASNYPHLSIRDEHGNTTNYRVSNLGEIMVLGHTNPKWDMLKDLSNETGNALKAVREHLGGIDFPAEAPHKGKRAWTMYVTHHGVTVAWGESFRDPRWYVDHAGNVTQSA